MLSNPDMDARTYAVGQRLAFPLGEFAALIGVSTRTVQRMGRRGDIELVRIGKRRFVPASVLEKLSRASVPLPGAETA